MKLKNIKTYIFLLIVILISIAFLNIIRPFFVPIFLSVVISILFYPFYQWLNLKKKLNRSFSAMFTIFLIYALIIFPLIGILTIINNEAHSFYNYILENQNQMLQSFQGSINNLEHNTYFNINISSAIKNINWAERVTDIVNYLNNFIITSLQSIFSNTLYSLFLLFLMTYTLYFLFIDGDLFVKTIRQFIPLNYKFQEKLLDKFLQTTRSILMTTLIIGVIEGFIGFILFATFGVPSAALWGIIMFILSVIPAIGATVIWVPAGIIKLIFGPWWQGMLILIIGAILFNSVDYIVRPKLIGKSISLHPLIILFSTLGGLFTLGIIGFILGPIIAALFIVIWEAFAQEFKTEK